MGRTTPTYRRLLRSIQDRWQAFRRALRREDQHHYDALLEQAERHADAATHANPADPTETVFLSVLIAHEKRLAALEEA